MKTIGKLTVCGSLLLGACAHNDNSSQPPSSVAGPQRYETPTASQGRANPMPGSAPGTPSMAPAPTSSSSFDSPGAASPGAASPGAASRDLTPERTDTTPSTEGTDRTQASSGTETASPRADADNTGINARDRDHAAVTPLDQGNNATDLKITQTIRKAIMSDGSLSFTAKNVKIISNGGKVVLRGPVKTAEERASIEAKVRATPGVTDVDDQLEVKQK